MTSIGAAVTAAAALVCEYLIVSVLFDATPNSPRLAPLTGGLGLLVPCAVSMATATYVLALPSGSKQLPVAAMPRRGVAIRAAFHVCCYGAFLLVTSRLFTATRSVAGHEDALFALWLLLAALTALSLVAVVVQPASIVRIVRERRRLVLLAVAAGLAAFFAGQAAERLWGSLGRFTLSGVAFVLRPVLGGLIVQPEELTIGTRQFLVEIAPVCSGFEGIGLITIFLALYLAAAWDRVAVSRALLLFPLGILAAWCANVARIAALIWVGSRWSAPLAAGGLHSKLGWLLFCGVAVGLVLIANRTVLVRSEPVESSRANPAAGHLLPFVALGVATLIVAIPSHAPLVLRALPAVAVAVAFWASGENRPSLRLSWSWEAPAFGAAAFALSQVAEWLIADAAPHATTTTVVDAVTLIVAVPLACELAFRGYLQRRLSGRPFEAVDPQRAGWIALIVAGAVYAATTGTFWIALPAGILYGVAYRRRGELGDAILAHAACNVLVVASLAFAASR